MYCGKIYFNKKLLHSYLENVYLPLLNICMFGRKIWQSPKAVIILFCGASSLNFHYTNMHYWNLQECGKKRKSNYQPELTKSLLFLGSLFIIETCAANEYIPPDCTIYLQIMKIPGLKTLPNHVLSQSTGELPHNTYSPENRETPIHRYYWMVFTPISLNWQIYSEDFRCNYLLISLHTKLTKFWGLSWIPGNVKNNGISHTPVAHTYKS
jgi:hypothetical protein